MRKGGRSGLKLRPLRSTVCTRANTGCDARTNATPDSPEISALIRWTARKTYYRHVPNSAGRGIIELSDLEHQGILGWLEAPEYDEAQNTPVTAFARPYVYGRMMDYLRKTLALVRVPQDRWAEVRTLQQAKEEMLQAGEAPGHEKLAARLGWPIGKVASVERDIPEPLRSTRTIAGADGCPGEPRKEPGLRGFHARAVDVCEANWPRASRPVWKS